jgi:hypothetical protein
VQGGGKNDCIGDGNLVAVRRADDRGAKSHRHHFSIGRIEKDMITHGVRLIENNKHAAKQALQ